MRWRLSALLALYLLASAPRVPGTARQGQPQAQPAPMRVNVALIPLAAEVTDKRGRFVRALAASDFTVLEDGRPQKIAYFQAEDQSLHLSLLVDSSSSMATGGKLALARTLLERLLRHSTPADEISMMEFSDRLGPLRRLTADDRLEASPATLASTKGGTALYDAIATALCRLQAGGSLRPAVVVITDGADQNSRLTLQELIGVVEASRAQLFMIGFFSQAEAAVYQNREKTVLLVSGREIDNPLVAFDRLAKESGAEAFFPSAPAELERALEAVWSTLAAEYTLAYYPVSQAGGFRRIEVKVNRGGVRVKARRGVEMSPDSSEPAASAPETCEISPQKHPYPYESRVTGTGPAMVYREDFSDARSGWPNRSGSRYAAGGYELSNGEAKWVNDRLVHSPGVLAAYGPWWEDSRASVVLDFAQASRYKSQDPRMETPPGPEATSAGLVFRLNDDGYYAFLLTAGAKPEQPWFELVRKSYSGLQGVIIPWTRVCLPKSPATSRRISVLSAGEQIVMYIDGLEAGRAKDPLYDRGYAGLALNGTGRAIFRDLQVEAASEAPIPPVGPGAACPDRRDASWTQPPAR